ncbi:MAG: 5-(carboxyamino)imidazole ribonucleotide synthase [Pseudomonadota bacterium]
MSAKRHVGVIGGGQLGRMLGLAGVPLGLDFVFLDPSEAPCAAGLGVHLRAAFDDPDALAELAGRVDVITYEFENVAVSGLAALAGRCPVRPAPEALATAQQRRREKACFERIGIPVAPWRAADDPAALDRAIAALGLPLVVKTDRFGYDGKGQRVLREPVDAAALFDELGRVPLLVEALVPFDCEVSIIGTRGTDGAINAWPLTLNEHRDGVLHESRCLPPDHALGAAARRHLTALLRELDYVGTLAIEFFVRDGTLLGNEFAPRVHNSGHWTIEGAVTSQFENHLRAVCGLPLGSTETHVVAVMRNFVGHMPDRNLVLGVPGLALHDYGKTPRPGRKLGHATIVAADEQTLAERLEELGQRLGAV